MTTPQTPAKLADECKRLADQSRGALGLEGMTYFRDRLHAAIDSLAALVPKAVPVELSDVQRMYIEQAAHYLDQMSEEQTRLGNDSTAKGAEASAHVLRAMLAAAPSHGAAQAEPPPVAAPPDAVANQQLTTAPADVLEEAWRRILRFADQFGDEETPGAVIEEHEKAVRSYLAAHLRAAPVPMIARQLGEWHEDDGPAAWWAWNGHEWAGEPAWIGTPLCDNWPGYHTHWTPHPAMPAHHGIKGAP